MLRGNRHNLTRFVFPLEICLIIVSGILAVWAGWAGARAGVNPGLIALWCVSVAALAMSGRIPEVALYAFVAVAHGTPRYWDAYTTLVEIGVLNGLCALAILGGVVWGIRTHAQFNMNDRLSLVMGLLIFWLLVTTAAALAGGQSWQPYPKHHPQQYLHGLVMFVLASQVLLGPSQALWFAMVVCGTVCVRGLLVGGGGVYLEADLAALAVISLPLAMLGIGMGRRWVVKAGFLWLAGILLWLTAVSQNRGAAVGLVAMLIVMGCQLRRRWRVLVGSIPVVVFVGILFAYSPYWQRFEGIWQGTDDRNSVVERLRIWDAGWRMFLDHPLMGVGPGNYHLGVDQYDSKLPRQRAAHNNYVQVVAETGAPGLALYVLLFGGAVVALWQVSEVAGPDWPGSVARMVLASIVAYLVIGLFISRQDMALAYLFVGWAVAIRGQWLGRRDPVSVDSLSAVSS